MTALTTKLRSIAALSNPVVTEQVCQEPHLIGANQQRAPNFHPSNSLDQEDHFASRMQPVNNSQSARRVDSRANNVAPSLSRADFDSYIGKADDAAGPLLQS